MNNSKINFSLVIPFFNEDNCIQPLCDEVIPLIGKQFGDAWEMLLVDDGSTDRTRAKIESVSKTHPQVRGVFLDMNQGQSGALEAGFRKASGSLIGTLDGDGQNDPADFPRMIQAMEKDDLDMMCGIRVNRSDTIVRRISSRIANRVRSRILGDGITDVGCSIRVMRKECADAIPMFRNAHRFLPALAAMSGYRIGEMPVSHRSRIAGISKYGGGIRSRLGAGLLDLAGVWWLRHRWHKGLQREASREA